MTAIHFTAYPRVARPNAPQEETFEQAYERLYPPEYEIYPGPETYPAPPKPYASSSPLYMPYTPLYVPGLPSSVIKPDSTAFATDSDSFSYSSSSDSSPSQEQYKSIRMHPKSRTASPPISRTQPGAKPATPIRQQPVPPAYHPYAGIPSRPLR